MKTKKTDKEFFGGIKDCDVSDLPPQILINKNHAGLEIFASLDLINCKLDSCPNVIF